MQRCSKSGIFPIVNHLATLLRFCSFWTNRARSSGLENKVEAAVDSFAAILHRKSPALGKIFMGIVEFNRDDANPIAVMDVKPLTFISTVKDYLYNFDGSTTNPNYQPGGTTDYVGALSRAQSVASANQVDIIFFITDGDPDTGPNTTPWIGTSDAIKNSGVYIFHIAVGSESSVKTCAITALSGIHKLGDSNPSGLPYQYPKRSRLDADKFRGISSRLG